MPSANQETEAKFYVHDLERVEARLQASGAQLIQPRTHELNLRFDTPAGDFQRDGRVLRLRRDRGIHLTYKDGGQLTAGALRRRELEFSADNFEIARQFLEALGYEVVFIYEKYRTIYQTSEVFEDLGGLAAHIMLDELPYGNFVEIEGELTTLQPIAQKLGLDWEVAIPASYHALFERISQARQLTFRDLSFENFSAIRVSPAELGVKTADQ